MGPGGSVRGATGQVGQSRRGAGGNTKGRKAGKFSGRPEAEGVGTAGTAGEPVSAPPGERERGMTAERRALEGQNFEIDHKN